MQTELNDYQQGYRLGVVEATHLLQAAGLVNLSSSLQGCPERGRPDFPGVWGEVSSESGDLIVFYARPDVDYTGRVTRISVQPYTGEHAEGWIQDWAPLFGEQTIEARAAIVRDWAAGHAQRATAAHAKHLVTEARHVSAFVD